MRPHFLLCILLNVCFIQTFYSQEYRKEFRKRFQMSETLAKSYIDSLSKSSLPQARTYAYAASTYLLIRGKNYGQIDDVFQLAFEELEKIRDRKQYSKQKLNVLYFYSNYLVTKHDTEILNKTLNEGLDLSLSISDVEMHIGFRNLQASYYNLLGMGEKVLQMTQKTIQELEASEGQLDDTFFKSNLSALYLNGANRSVSLYMLDSDKYETYLDTAKVFLKKANEFFTKYAIQPRVNQQIQLTNIRGAVEFYKKDYEEAIGYFTKGLINASENGLKKRVFQSKFKIAECHFFLGNYTKAKQLFDELSKDELDQYRLILNSIRINYYYAMIYQELGDVDKSLEYSKIFNEELPSYYRDISEEKLNVIVANELKSKQKIIKDLEIANKKVKQRDDYIIIGVLIAVVMIGAIIFYIKLQRRRFKGKVNKLLAHIESLENNQQETVVLIEEEKAQTILTKLKKIEKQQFFTSQSYSLNKVAKKIGSNSTYVSQAINTYWKKSFTEYTNELRINYILLKLKNDKHYQKFKLEAIAESAGYKSVRSFNKHFKTQTGLLPKLYIELIEKQQLH